MATAFALFALLAGYKGAVKFGLALGFLSFAFLITGALFPCTLKGVHRRWMRFAEVIGAFNAKLILGLMYYAVFTPVRFVFALLGKDPMKRKPEPDAETYWVAHEPQGDDPKRFERQF